MPRKELILIISYLIAIAGLGQLSNRYRWAGLDFAHYRRLLRM